MSDQRLRWLVRRFREAARDNQWLIPAIGAVFGFVLAMLIGTGVDAFAAKLVGADALES